MIQKLCPECNGELGLARRPNNERGSGTFLGSLTYWRCGICGRGFTAEEIRKNKRDKPTPATPA